MAMINRARLGLLFVTLSFLRVIGSDTLAADKILIGFSQATMNSAWRVAMSEGNKKYASEHYPEVELAFTDGQNQAARQISDVESLLSRGIKVLIISPVQAEPLTPVVRKVMEAKYAWPRSNTV